jgi:predicted transglutaminase-like cysteine proteinase
MVWFRGAAGTGRIVACVLALAVGAPAAFAQSAEPSGPARFFRISDVLKKIDAGQKPGSEEPVRLAARTNGDILSDVPLRGSIPQIGEEPFGLFGFRAPEGILWRKWRSVASDMAGEDVVLARCRESAEDCTPAARRFLAILGAVKARAGRAQLEEVNRQINAAIRYVSDMAQHGEADRWTAPLAALAAGRGDCEDYAIAKYAILREAGFPFADLRFLLVRDKLARDDHAVLAARLEGQWLILDNRFLKIPEDREMHNFTPLFALDNEGVKLVAAPYAKVPIVVDGDTKPAALFESEDIALRGALAAEDIQQAPAFDQAVGAGD